jgi:hypothetical protein
MCLLETHLSTEISDLESLTVGQGFLVVILKYAIAVTGRGGL